MFGWSGWRFVGIMLLFAALVCLITSAYFLGRNSGKDNAGNRTATAFLIIGVTLFFAGMAILYFSAFHSGYDEANSNRRAAANKANASKANASKANASKNAAQQQGAV